MGKREGCENLCLGPVNSRAARDRVARIALPLAALKLERLGVGIHGSRVARIALPLAALKPTDLETRLSNIQSSRV